MPPTIAAPDAAAAALAALEASPITDLLYVAPHPRGEDRGALLDLGVRLVISMHWLRPPRDLGHPPLTLLWLPTVDSPLIPMPMSRLRAGVRIALPYLERGDGVLVHCKAGVHRSVAMAVCILIAQGMDPIAAMDLVKARRGVADPYAWHIRRRIMSFAMEWRAHAGSR